MKGKFFLAAAMVLMTLVGTTSFAQNTPPPPPDAQPQPGGDAAPRAGRGPKLTLEQRVDREVDKLNTMVQLTPDQQTKVRALFTKLLTERENNRIAANGDRDKMKALNSDIGTQRRDGLKAILTKDQQAKLKQAQQAQRAARKGGGPGPGGPDGPPPGE
jgi:Spy/CpxP family protein refolding chaperone